MNGGNQLVFFSIIIPCYNVESYVKECVNSVLGQSYGDFEVILVNDGSTDKTGAICDEIAKQDPRVRVIHKKNGGLSDARNAGLTRTIGRYVIFIDSDDYIEAGSLERFRDRLKIAEYPDVLITRLKEVSPDSGVRLMDRGMPLGVLRADSREGIIDWMFNCSDNLWPAVRYIVKHSLIERNNLRFAVGHLHEDLDWTSRIFLYAQSFTILGFYWYNHRVNRAGSITTDLDPKRTLDVIQLVAKNIEDSEYNAIDHGLRDIIFSRLVKSLFVSLSNYKYYDQDGKRAVVDALCKNKGVFRYTTVLRHRLFIAFCKLFGFRVGLALMSIIHKV